MVEGSEIDNILSDLSDKIKYLNYLERAIDKFKKILKNPIPLH